VTFGKLTSPLPTIDREIHDGTTNDAFTDTDDWAAHPATAVPTTTPTTTNKPTNFLILIETPPWFVERI
jgi:hypothetical protein